MTKENLTPATIRQISSLKTSASAGFNDDTFLVAELSRVAAGIVSTLGEELCEVVLHDFSQPEHSIVWIRGKVTNRELGGSMSQIGLAMMAEGNDAQDRINYITRTKDGKVLKSTSIVLRDATGQAFGLFCINIDITSLTLLENTLKNFLAGEETKILTNVHFSNNVAEVAQTLLDEVIQERGWVGPPLDMEQRLAFVKALDQRGFFGIRYTVPLLADYLGVSRAAIYSYIKEITKGAEQKNGKPEK